MFQQRQFQSRKPGLQSFPAGPQFVGGSRQLGVTIAVGHQRGELLDLLPGLEDRLVGLVEIVEVLDQGLDAGGHVKGLQHVGAHEIGEVAHGFEGHGLVEELQGLVVVDPEAPPEPGRVRRETVPDRDA